jgi:hypothetical protein
MVEMNNAFRFAGSALIAAATTVVLGTASILGAARLPRGPIQGMVWVGGIILGIAIGVAILDRGYRRTTTPITPLYITGLLLYILGAILVFFRILVLLAASAGKLEL